MKKKLLFYERYWREKKSDELFDFAYKWPVLKRYIPTEKNVTLLDYGCGTGFLLSHIQKYNKFLNLIGADISEEGLRRARKNVKGGDFIQLKNDEPMDIKKNSIDFVTCLDVIEHVYDTEFVLQDVSRVIKPGGKILISTPYHGIIKNIVISLIGFETVFDPTGPHIRFFTRYSLQHLMEKSGFAVKKIGFYGRFFPLWRGFYMLCEKV